MAICEIGHFWKLRMLIISACALRIRTRTCYIHTKGLVGALPLYGESTHSLLLTQYYLLSYVRWWHPQRNAHGP